MVNHAVIRRMHAWGIEQTDAFTVAAAAEALGVSTSSAYLALCELVNAGFGSRQAGDKPAHGGKNNLVYFITGATDDCAARFSQGLGKPPNPPPMYARVSSVFEYGERCALAVNKGT